MSGVSGCLVAALSAGGRHVMTSHQEEAEITRRVIEESGLAAERRLEGDPR
jgi:hypothetical protein